MDLGADASQNEVHLEAIAFPAAVYKVQTLTDGGVRVTLDLPETAIMEMAMLAECQRAGVYLNVLCTAADETRPRKNPDGRKRT